MVWCAYTYMRQGNILFGRMALLLHHKMQAYSVPALSHDFYHGRMELQEEGNNQSEQCDCVCVTVKELQS